jgi:hypothetical protein
MSTTDRQQFREVLASLATKTLVKIPALNGRTEKACKLVLGGDVTLQADGTAQVGSLTDPDRTYLVGHGACDCQDYDRAPEHLCSHRLAVGFQRKVQELLPPPPAPGPPLPEAPASANVRMQLHGHDVQVTLRDVSEANLMTRLEALLQTYGTAQAPTTPPAGDMPKCPTHGFLRQGKRGWFCPVKVGQGYCDFTVKPGR